MSGRAARAKGSSGNRSEPRSGGSGVVLDSLEAVIRASATPRAWRRLVEATGMSAMPGAGTSKRKVGYASYFYALPTGAVGPLYLYGDLRPSPGAEADAQLKLRWELLPEGPTPQQITSSSRAVGGWPEVLRRLSADWPGTPGKEAVSVDVTASFVIDEAALVPVPALRLKPKPVRQGGHQLAQTAVAWSVDPPSGPVHRVSVARLREGELVVAASGRHTLPLGPDMAAALEGAVWQGVATFLRAP
ncbi:hypothetical protein [Sorangium sp. So ce1024]|uniref:hypothetical protein n=1 Tax=unclassified Sorangium TaxID=2621164 RepID=UPI003F0BB230